MRLSVIICTYNREKYIYQALESIAKQDFPVDKFEIVLIDNNSTDNTGNICKEFNKNFSNIHFHYFFEEEQGLSYARNRGIKESKGEILIFVDDDATVFDNYLKSIDTFFNTYTDAIVCGGPIIPVYEIDKPRWLSHFTEHLIGGALYMGKNITLFKNGKYPGGGNSALVKEVFQKYGVYNTELGRKGTSLIGAEEKDLYDRIYKDGKKVYYLPQMGIYHYIPEKKLTDSHFKELTYSIGKSERIRTLSISKKKYYLRIARETVKWGASFILFFLYLISFTPSKGIKLLEFRWFVTKGLSGK